MTSYSNFLLITKSLDKSPQGGRELLCKLNHDVLHKMYGDKLYLFELSAERLHGVFAYFSAFLGNIDGLNNGSILNAVSIINQDCVGKVFIDGSNLGKLVSYVKLHYPTIEITTFFHNVEARFFWGAFIQNKSLRALAVLIANYLAERKAVRNSDKIICLSKRDSQLLYKLYGRKATHIAPMALEDKYQASTTEKVVISSKKFALFVGGAFYANQSGIAWFVREVVPKINLPIYIVGRGLDEFREELEVPGKVFVIGAVDSLAEWYRDAQFVIAPIFDGSGMKTKIAEALMHGKKVIGSPEAFSGYEDVVSQAGWLCHTTDDFVNAVFRAQIEIIEPFDVNLREIYLQRYSLAAAHERLKCILS